MNALNTSASKDLSQQSFAQFQLDLPDTESRQAFESYKHIVAAWLQAKTDLMRMLSSIKGLFAAYQARRASKIVMTEVGNLSDYQLKDVGLYRSSAEVFSVDPRDRAGSHTFG